MDHKTNIPGIRFKGFQNEWNRQVLGELAEKVTDKNGNGMISETFTNSAEHGVISQRDFFDHDISKVGKTNGYYVIQDNDFVYNPRISVTAPCGPVNCNRLGRPGVMSPLYTVFRTHDVDTLFLEWFFKSEFWHSYMRFNGDSGARSDRFSIRSELFFNMPIYMPEDDEQCMIGTLLKNMNNHIAFLQKKQQKLQSLRLSMLEKLFPKTGSSVPEVRFKEFSGEWNRVELSEIADKVTEKNGQGFVTETFTNSAEHGVISQRDFFDHDIAKAGKTNGYYIIQKDDFVYNPRISVTAPCGPINCNRLGRQGVMSPLYTVFRTHDVDNLFLEWYFKSPHWYSYMRFNGDSGARSDRFSIKNELFFKMPIPLPGIEEQRKIGQVLQELHNNMVLCRQELDKLHALKKALLKKMFI